MQSNKKITVFYTINDKLETIINYHYQFYYNYSDSHTYNNIVYITKSIDTITREHIMKSRLVEVIFKSYNGKEYPTECCYKFYGYYKFYDVNKNGILVKKLTASAGIIIIFNNNEVIKL